jgi:hypothetical protein
MALASASSHCRASFSSSFIGGNAWAKPVTLCVVEPVDGSAPKSPRKNTGQVWRRRDGRESSNI